MTENIPAGTAGNAVFESITYNEWPKGSKAIRRIMEKQVAEYLPEAQLDPEFCRHGGEVALRARYKNACPKTLVRLTQLLKAENPESFSKSIAKCTGERRYNSECTAEKQKEAFIQKYGNSRLVTAIAKKRTLPNFPTPMRTTLIDRLPLSTWLPQCIDRLSAVRNTHGVFTYSVQGQTAPMANDPADAFFTPLILPLSMKVASPSAIACFSAIRSAIEKQKYDIGKNLSDGEILLILNESSSFIRTIQSFEQWVIRPLTEDAADSGWNDLKQSAIARRVLGAWFRKQPEFSALNRKAILDSLPLFYK